MPCTCDISQEEQARHWITLLCQACRFLTKDEIDSLRNPGSGIMDGLEWYLLHLHGDSISSESDEKERNFACQELLRLGYEITYSKGYSELIKIADSEDASL
jgi:hypothetical protein